MINLESNFDQTITRAIDKFGAEKQLRQMQEEAGELIVATNKMLRENNNNISAFFTKLPIKFQFTIINHFLVTKHKMGIVILPDSFRIYKYNIHPFDETFMELLAKVDIEDINDTTYENSIIVAFSILHKEINRDNNQLKNPF